MALKAIVVSDTHGHLDNLKRVLQLHEPDMLIHAGDVGADADKIYAMANCVTHIVKGNNDFFSDYPKEDFFEFGGRKIFLTHGHTYGVYSGLNLLRYEGLERGADVVIYGHTHYPDVNAAEGDITLINPGSLSQPRQPGRQPSYIIFEIDRYDEAHFTIAYLK